MDLIAVVVVVPFHFCHVIAENFMSILAHLASVVFVWRKRFLLLVVVVVEIVVIVVLVLVVVATVIVLVVVATVPVVVVIA